jgi:hypothetical protein
MRNSDREQSIQANNRSILEARSDLQLGHNRCLSSCTQLPFLHSRVVKGLARFDWLMVRPRIPSKVFVVRPGRS